MKVNQSSNTTGLLHFVTARIQEAHLPKMAVRKVLVQILAGFAVILSCLTFTASAEAKTIALVKEGSYAISSSLLQGILAKEICSCVFVSKVGGDATPYDLRAQKCIARSQLPLSPGLISLLLHEKIDPKTTSLEVTPKILGALLGLFQGHGSLAVYEGEKQGCRLLTDEERRQR